MNEKLYALKLLLSVVVFILFFGFGLEFAIRNLANLTQNWAIQYISIFIIIFIFGAFYYGLTGKLLGNAESRKESFIRMALHWILNTFSDMIIILFSTVLLMSGGLIVFTKLLDIFFLSPYEPLKYALSLWLGIHWNPPPNPVNFDQVFSLYGYLIFGAILTWIGSILRSDQFLDKYLDLKESAQQTLDKGLGYNESMKEWKDELGNTENQQPGPFRR